MREEKMVFDYPLVDEQWVGAAPQYGYSNDNQGDIDVGPLSAHENPRPIRYGNRYVVPQEVCRRTAIMEYPPYGYEQTARRSSGSTTTSGVAYSTSGERSPTMRSYRPEPRETSYSSIKDYGGYSLEVAHQSAKPSKRYYCDFPDCVDPATGKRRSVGRKADLKRHINSVHGQPSIDCEFRKCWRRGDEGFCREDHHREHLRGYHGQEVPKTGRRNS